MSLVLPIKRPGLITPVLRRMRDANLRVGILHSGGPAPGGNRVVAGAAKQFLDCGVGVIGFFDGFEHLQGTAPDQLTPGLHYLDITGEIASSAIDQNALFIRTSRANPGKRIQKPEDLANHDKTQDLRKILDAFQFLRIGALISIGGDDTLKTANFIQLLARDYPGFLGVAHAPKTIDNDYYGIPWTFGFFTAAESAGRILRGLYDDAKGTKCYHIVELMGRKAGWYTAAAAIYGRATKALIPEDYGEVIDLDQIAADLLEIIIRREKNNKGYGVIAVAEGLADKLPQKTMRQDRHGNPILSDAKIGLRLAEVLTKKYKERTEKDKSFKINMVGYETRQIQPGLYDALLTSQLGVGAFRLIANGQFGQMVTVKDNLEISGIPFQELIDPTTLLVKIRKIDTDGDFYRLLRSLELHYQKNQ